VPTRAAAVPGRVYEECAGADLILHAGDVVELDVLYDLERFAPLKAVRGNMDTFQVAEKYPEYLVLELEGFSICMTHGFGARFRLKDRLLERYRHLEPEILIYGHTHVFDLDRMNGVMRLNPGAVAGAKGKRSFAVLNLEKGGEPEVKRITF